MENLSRFFFKDQKQIMKRLSFICQCKIEFLLLFTGFRKVLGKMRARRNQAYSGIIQTYSDTCITLAYSELWYFQNPGTF